MRSSDTCVFALLIFRDMTTGHSLGGAYANAVFLQLLAERDPLLKPVLEGGVYTFGAPLIVYKHPKHSSSQLLHMLFLQQHDASRWGVGSVKLSSQAALPASA